MIAEKPISQLLLPTATAAERTSALMILLPPDILADAIGVKPSSLRNWCSGQSQPRSHAAIALDDLRATAKVLLDGQVEPERASAWLISRDPERWEGTRPLEFLRENPMEVVGAAHGVVLELERAREEAKTTAQRKRRRRERELVLVSGAGD